MMVEDVSEGKSLVRLHKDPLDQVDGEGSCSLREPVVEVDDVALDALPVREVVRVESRNSIEHCVEEDAETPDVCSLVILYSQPAVLALPQPGLHLDRHVGRGPYAWVLGLFDQSLFLDSEAKVSEVGLHGAVTLGGD